jgi:RimJ/RimL family protein N-acetyltransferase
MPNHEFILETSRLLLRKKVVEDVPFFFEMNADPLVNKYTGDVPFKDMKGAEGIVRYVINQYNTNGYGRWMVLEKETNTPLGWCGLKYHEDTKETDLGYRFMQKYWGKGYATESAIACLDYGFNVLKLDRIIGRAMNENIASVTVLKKIGMKLCQHVELHGVPSVVYELKKEDYR